MRELAVAVQRSHVAVSKWVNDPRWPFAKRGPWDVGKVREWMAATLADPGKVHAGPSGDADPFRAMEAMGLEKAKKLAEIKAKTEQALLCKLKRKILGERYVPKDGVKGMLVDRARTLRAAFERLHEVIDEARSLKEAKELVRMAVVRTLTEFARDGHGGGHNPGGVVG